MQPLLALDIIVRCLVIILDIMSLDTFSKTFKDLTEKSQIFENVVTLYCTFEYKTTDKCIMLSYVTLCLMLKSHKKRLLRVIHCVIQPFWSAL